MTITERKVELERLLVGRTIVGVEWKDECWVGRTGDGWDGEVGAFILDDGARVSFSASGQVDVDDVWLAVEHPTLHGEPAAKVVREAGP